MEKKIHHLVNVSLRVVENSGSKSRESWFPANPRNVISFSKHVVCSCSISHSLISCLSNVSLLFVMKGWGSHSQCQKTLQTFKFRL